MVYLGTKAVKVQWKFHIGRLINNYRLNQVDKEKVFDIRKFHCMLIRPNLPDVTGA